jgi:hypothetical protein
MFSCLDLTLSHGEEKITLHNILFHGIEICNHDKCNQGNNWLKMLIGDILANINLGLT